MKNIKKIIPHLFTGGNLVCGCLAIVHVLQGNLIFGAYFVAFAAFLDFFDGFAARALGVSGEFGKQFDSLADCVTFGVVPGMVLMFLIDKSITIENLTLGNQEKFQPELSLFPLHNLSYFALLIPVFSAVRLAKFNIDIRQSDTFIGLPTPANSIFILSIGYIVSDTATNFELKSFLMRKEVLILIAIVFSYLLVAELPLFALKFKNFKWNDNKVRYLFLICCVILFLLFQVLALPLIISLYIFINLMLKLFSEREV